MSRVIGYLAAWSALCVAAGGVKPAPVSVPRCCPAGQALSADTLRLAVLPAGAAPCAPAAPVAWTPRVYAPSRGTLLAPGFLPPHWRVVQGQLPACEPLRVLPEHAAPYALLANNGFMLLRRASAPLPPDRYCADATAALVCEADAPLEPSKCCAEGSAFNGTSCVEAEERGREALEELRALSNGSVGVGWPACPEGSRYAHAAHAVRRGAGGGRGVPGGHAGGRLRAAGGAPRAALALPDALRGGADAGRRAAGGHAAGGGPRAGRPVPRAGCVYAFPVPVGVLLAEHDVLQHLVDFPRLPADVAGARAGAVAAARVHGVRVGGAAAAGGRGRRAGRAAARRRRALPAPALRRAALLVLRRHGDPRLLLRARGRAAARQPGAVRVHHAPAHVRPVAPRRGQVHVRAGGAGASLRQAGGGDGRDVGRRRGVVGGGRARLRVVRHGLAERAAGRLHLPGGGVPAARVGGAEARGGGVLRARAARGSRHALLHAPAVLRRVAHTHHARARRRRACACRRTAARPHGDRVLSDTFNFAL